MQSRGRKETTTKLRSMRLQGLRDLRSDLYVHLNRLIKDNQAEINKILLGYGVPLIDEQDKPITQ